MVFLFRSPNVDNGAKTDISDQIDEIQYRDKSIRTTFVSLSISGTSEA